MLPTPFITVEEADASLVDPDNWDGGTLSEKEQALSYGRIFIEANYNCWYTEEDAPDVLKLANALLADAHMGKDIFVTEENKGVKRKMVKAGPVITDTMYDNYASKTSDPHPKVTALLATIGVTKVSKSMNANLIRG